MKLIDTYPPEPAVPPTKINDHELLERLAGVFRDFGYEGASLSRIAEATGLQRASLYHRFPGGKEQMAQAVMDTVDDVFVREVLAPLTGPGTPARRGADMARRLGRLYDGGGRSCLLDALSRGDAPEALRGHVEVSFAAWLSAMAKLAREAGATPAEAKRRAQDAMVRIQGGLVVARASGDRKPFKRALAGLPELLAGEA